MQDFLDQTSRHRAAFEQFCLSLTEEELARPVPRSAWDVKAYIAHLGTIDTTVRTWFERLLGDGGAAQAPTADGASGRAFDIDRWNEAQVAARADWSLEQILEEMRSNRAALDAVVARFTPEVLDGEMHFPGDRDRPPAQVHVGGYLQALALHDPAHALDMLRALPEKADDPELADWLGPFRSMLPG